MSAHGLNFDWYSLDRNAIADFISLIAPKIVNQEIAPDKFHKIISKHLKSYIPLRIARSFDPKVKKNIIFIGGCYYSHLDQAHKTSIEVMIVYNPIDEILKINKRRFQRICYGIADTILHELIHMRQFRRREFKYLPEYDSNANRTAQRLEQAYLGCSDEIDAYGFNIACELLEKNNNNSKAVIKHLNIDQKNVRKQSDCWRMYLKAFNHDHDHIIIRRLKKKIIRYLPNAAIGKPYRNRDWICY
jgi:hypothetical protein